MDAKYIVSVVDLRQEGTHFCLSKDDLTAITSYIKETAATFAPVVPASEKVTEKKRKNSHSASHNEQRHTILFNNFCYQSSKEK